MAQGEETPQDSGFSDLEEKLADLRLTPADAGFVRKLGRQFDALEQDREEKRALWRRFVPVAATACLLLTSTLFFQAYLEDQAASLRTSAEGGAPPADSPSVPFRSPAVGKVSGDFLPVSSGEFFRGATDGAIVGVEENGQPLREVYLEYEKQWRFHEPETGTNLEFIWPEEAVIVVPVETD